MRPVGRIKKFLLRKLSTRARFRMLLLRRRIFLYAGDVPEDPRYEKYVGLSLSKSDLHHIHHDVTNALPLPDSCVDIYQSEDVFEHIDSGKLESVLTEIYRVLKPGGLFRLSMPDYRCDLLRERSLKDDRGNIVFDPGGGGEYIDQKVVKGGHVWFPTYEQVYGILKSTPFTEVTFYHYYREDGTAITNAIDYSLGFVKRTPDNDERVQSPYRPMSIVVDCRK